MMRRLLLRYKIQTLLIAVFVVGCLLAISNRARRIHRSATSVEANGGDVWLGDTVYSGGGFGNVKPRTKTQQMLAQAGVLCGILVGQETDLWVTSIPDDLDEFSATIDVLNPSSISFAVLGKTERVWMGSQFPNVTLSGTCVPDAGINHDEVAVTEWHQETPTEQLAQDEFIKSMEDFTALLEANPQLYYRLDRYETLIGYPRHGEMGRLLDKNSGRIIDLPWPK